MSFREKSLWVMVAALLLASFFYGHAVAYVSHEQFETVPWHAMRVLAPMVEPAMNLLRRVRSAWRQEAWQLEANAPRTWAT